VECDPVIEAALREGLDSLDVARREIRPHRDYDPPFCRLENERVFRILGHDVRLSYWPIVDEAEG
jgi:hypothetical protein